MTRGTVGAYFLYPTVLDDLNLLKELEVVCVCVCVWGGGGVGVGVGEVRLFKYEVYKMIIFQY